MKKKSKTHPGFAKVAAKIERKEGVSKKTADKILGAANAKRKMKGKK
jgi:hypothetical protein